MRPINNIEINNIKRKQQIRLCFNLECDLFEIAIEIPTIFDDVLASCENFLKKNTLVGIGKIITQIHGENEKDLLTELHNYVSLANEKNQKPNDHEVKKSFNKLTKEINWAPNIRELFEQRLARTLPAYKNIKRIINRSIKEFSDNQNRINKFIYKTFLFNYDSYPLNEDNKKIIIDRCQTDINTIESILELNFLKNIETVISSLELLDEYTKNKNEIIMSINRYIMSVCYNNKIRDEDDIIEITNEVIIDLSRNLYKFKIELSFINFIHQYIINSISALSTRKKIVRCPLHIEQRRKPIYAAYHEYCQLYPNKEIDYEIVADIYNSNSNSKRLKVDDIRTYIETEKIKSFSDMQTDGKETKPLNFTSIAHESLIYNSPEEINKTSKDYENIFKVMERLSDMDKRIIKMKFLESEDFTIQEIASAHNVSYDQCRRKIENFMKTIRNQN
jgi:RNA polymerase sigma factor (sigma-70 family)